MIWVRIIGVAGRDGPASLGCMWVVCARLEVDVVRRSLLVIGDRGSGNRGIQLEGGPLQAMTAAPCLGAGSRDASVCAKLCAPFPARPTLHVGWRSDRCARMLTLAGPVLRNVCGWFERGQGQAWLR